MDLESSSATAAGRDPARTVLTKRPASRPRSATTTSSNAGRKSEDGSSFKATRERRSSSKAASSSRPPTARSSFSTDSFSDSFRSRSATMSSNNTTHHSFDQGSRPFKSPASSTSFYGSRHMPTSASQSGGYSFPMPPQGPGPATLAASPLSATASLQQNAASVPWPSTPFASSTYRSQSGSKTENLCHLHEEPESYLPHDLPAARASTSAVRPTAGKGSGSGSTAQSGPVSANDSVPSAGQGSGWKALARKASGKFRRSFSTSGSSLNLAHEAGQHPMPPPPVLHTPVGEQPQPFGESVSPASSSSPVQSSHTSPGFLGGMMQRKKSRDSLNGSGSESGTTRRPKPTWDDLPPSPQAVPKQHQQPPQQMSHSPKFSVSHSGAAKSLKLGKGKQRLDQVQIAPFEISPNTPVQTEGGLLASPTHQSLSRRASTEVMSSQNGVPRSGMPRSMSAQQFPLSSGGSGAGHSRIQSPISPLSASPSSSTRSSSLLSSPPPQHIDDDDPPPPVPPLPLDHPKSPITFGTDRASLVPKGPPPRLSSRPPDLQSTPASPPQSPGPDTPSASDPPDTPPTAVPTRLRFPAAFGFVPRPDEDEGPDDVFGAAASAAEPPVPYQQAPSLRSEDSFLSTSSSSANSSASLRNAFPKPPTDKPEPPKPQRNKKLEFEELLMSDIGTMKISLTPERTKK